MHLLADLLLTDDWKTALAKVAFATNEARPDLRIDRRTVSNLDQSYGSSRRFDCRDVARRLKHDADHLDLAWLMLAANPRNPVVTAGFLDRLEDVVVKWADGEGIDTCLLNHNAMRRLERWLKIRDGMTSQHIDFFHATSDAGWKETKRIAEIAEKAEKNHAETPAEEARRLAGITKPDSADASEPMVPATVVIPANAEKLAEPYKSLAGKALPLVMTPELAPLRTALRAEFPHAHAAVDMMMIDLREGEPLAWRPFLLLGDPGCGKSRLVRRLCEHLGAKLRRYDGAASADNAFGGTPKRWSTASPSFPTLVVAQTKSANPVVMIDEIDKAGGNGWNGSLGNALMPFLERETARNYPDVGLDLEVDLSRLSYAATANDVTSLPAPLRDRMRVIRVPTPGVDHLPMLTASILRDVAADRGVDVEWMEPLAPDELEVVARAWRGGDMSVRKLQKIVSATVTARDEFASRH